MLYNTFIIINNNWKMATEEQKHIFVDEQGAKNLQQAKDDNKITGITETLTNGDSQKVSEEQKIKENNQGISADDQLGVNVECENKPEAEYQTIRIMGCGKTIDSNIVKVGAAQCAVMAANALVGFSNPIGLMICIAIAFKKLAASTKNIEFEQDAGKIKKIGGIPDGISVEVDGNGDIKEEDLAEFLSGKNNTKKIVLKIDKKMLAEIDELFSKKEQEKCAETNKIEINEDQAKKLSKILNCNVKAGILDFNDEKSLSDVLGISNVPEERTPKDAEVVKALTSILNPKINEKILQTQQTSARRVMVEGRGATSLS